MSRQGLSLAVIVLAVLATGGAAAQPGRSRLTEKIDYEDFRLWSLQWEVGEPPPAHRFDGPLVLLYARSVILRGRTGDRETTHPREFGDVDYLPGGGLAALPRRPTDRALQAHVVEWLQASRPRRGPSPSYPAAFPRPGADRVLDNEHFSVWRYVLRADAPSPLLSYDRPHVRLWLDDGEVRIGYQRETSGHVTVVRGSVSGSTGPTAYAETATTGPIGVVYLQVK